MVMGARPWSRNRAAQSVSGALSGSNGGSTACEYPSSASAPSARPSPGSARSGTRTFRWQATSMGTSEDRQVEALLERRVPVVHVHHGTVDDVGLLGGQERHHVGDLVWLGHLV